MKKTQLEYQEFQYPNIDPICKSYDKPLWSVMIPTYNTPAGYLAQTLESILSQDLGSERMQIKVLDNCSTENDPEALVQEMGKGRVTFYRHPQNIGMVGNFNACIRHSEGELVHILHSDDYVGTGFYQRFSELAEAYPQVDLFSCRVFEVNAQGEIELLSPRLKLIEALGHDVSDYFYQNPFRPCAVVIRRRFHERFGGYCESLNHTPDWEMYIRVLQKSLAIGINEPLAYYRWYGDNTSSNLARNGENLRDWIRLQNIFSAQYKDFEPERFNHNLKDAVFWQAYRFLTQNDRLAAKKNTLFWWSLHGIKGQVKQLSFLRLERPRIKLMLNLLRN
jgi:glycosyltransferase involved in cell wall biosynthesis